MLLKINISRLPNIVWFAQNTKLDYQGSKPLPKYLQEDALQIDAYGTAKTAFFEKIRTKKGIKKMQSLQRYLHEIEPLFTTHWRSAAPHLSLWKEYLLAHERTLQKILTTLYNLTSTRGFTARHIPFYLIADPTNPTQELSAWFSWTPKKSFVVIEIPLAAIPSQTLFPVGIVAHEILHLLLRKNIRLFTELKNLAKDNAKLWLKTSDLPISPENFLEELLVSSFVPEGYLGEKYLQHKIKRLVMLPNDLLDWRRLIAYHMRTIARNYAEKNKAIDLKYMEYLLEVIKKIPHQFPDEGGRRRAIISD